MSAFKSAVILSAFLTALFLQVPASWAAENNSDPNASIRKSVNPLASSALADVERVQKTNNTLAVEHFTKLIAKDPKDALSYSRRGKAYAGLKKHEEAMKDYDQAVRLKPDLAEAYVNRAVARFVLKDYDKSWEDVHKARSLGGEFWPSFEEGLKTASGRNE